VQTANDGSIHCPHCGSTQVRRKSAKGVTFLEHCIAWEERLATLQFGAYSAPRWVVQLGSSRVALGRSALGRSTLGRSTLGRSTLRPYGCASSVRWDAARWDAARCVLTGVPLQCAGTQHAASLRMCLFSTLGRSTLRPYGYSGSLVKHTRFASYPCVGSFRGRETLDRSGSLSRWSALLMAGYSAGVERSFPA
jgi:hypothetical protein